MQVFWECFKSWDPNYEEEKYKRVIEDLISATPKEEEASITSPIEDQAHEEDPIDENIQISMLSFHEEKGLVNHDLLQISEFNDAFTEDLEEDMFED